MWVGETPRTGSYVSVGGHGGLSGPACGADGLVSSSSAASPCPSGSLTVLLSVNVALMTIIHDKYLDTGPYPLIAAAILAGLVGDALLWWLRRLRTVLARCARWRSRCRPCSTCCTSSPSSCGRAWRGPSILDRGDRHCGRGGLASQLPGGRARADRDAATYRRRVGRVARRRPGRGPSVRRTGHSTSLPARKPRSRRDSRANVLDALAGLGLASTNPLPNGRGCRR